MRIIFDSDFLKEVKKLDVRIRKSLKERIKIFSQDPNEPLLHNHPLKREYTGYRSINITANYRAIFQATQEGGETIYYFFSIGTHKQLYRKYS